MGEFDGNGFFSNFGICGDVIEGTLEEPSGTYIGQFKEGKKHGEGTYNFVNNLKYIGRYVNGEKEGKGTIYNGDGTIGYSGEWKAGLPHGKGFTVTNHGDRINSEY